MKRLRHLLLFAGTMLSCFYIKAQNGQYDVQFFLKKWDCAAKKVVIQVQVKAHDAAHTFRMGDANYRFEYDSRQITAPRIVKQENFSNIAPASDLNYGSQNLNGSSEGPTLGIVSLNTFYSGTNQGARLVDNNWTPISCIEFDVLALSGCFPITWHDDKTFPITGMNEVELRGGGDYNLHVVNAGGVFNNIQACKETFCGSNIVHTVAISPIAVAEDSIITTCFKINDSNIYDTFKAITCGDPKNGTASFTINNDTRELCIMYKPNPNFEGQDEICIDVCDNNSPSLCQKVRIPITIAPRGDAPSVVIRPLSVESDSTVSSCLDIIDPDKNDVFKVTTCNTAKGSVKPSIQGNQVCFTYTSLQKYIGQDTVCLSICDSYGNCTKALIPILVTACVDRNNPILKCPSVVEVSTFGEIISNTYDFISKVTLNDNCDGVKINFDMPTAKSDCGTPSVFQTSGLPSGSTFSGSSLVKFQAKTANGLTAQCDVTIRVTSANLITPDIDSVTICTGQEFTLMGKRSDRATFRWVGTNGFNSPTQSIRFVRATPDYSATYKYILNTGRCIFEDSIYVRILDKPKALPDVYKIQRGTILQNNIVKNDTILPNAPIKARIRSSVQKGTLSFSPNGDFGFIPAPDFKGRENFIYEVCYEQCPNSCDIAKVDIDVYSNERVDDRATNIITPNGDGVNDVLIVEGLDANSPDNKSEMTIYNQWGNVVYQAQPYRNDWGGTFRNAGLPDGTYYYIFTKEPNTEPLKSFVTIMR
jgi:gliding motility-associated-like protein